MQQDSLLPDEKQSWFYHRGHWSTMSYSTTAQATYNPRMSGRRSVRRDYNRIWLHLGPRPVPDDYTGFLASIYVYTGKKLAPHYLIVLASFSTQEEIFVQDLPDLVEILALLAPLASHGVFAYTFSQHLQ
jgi:hypothetical protein